MRTYTAARRGLFACPIVSSYATQPDVRFAKDKTPYKTHQGAFVAAATATGWYVEISARGTRVGAGFYDADSKRLAAIREGMADAKTGGALDRILRGFDRDGWQVDGDQLKTAPRGYDRDHPRIHLLRHRQLFVGRHYGFEAEDIGPQLLERVRSDWRALRPLVEWLASVPKEPRDG